MQILEKVYYWLKNNWWKLLMFPLAVAYYVLLFFAIIKYAFREAILLREWLHEKLVKK